MPSSSCLDCVVRGYTDLTKSSLPSKKSNLIPVDRECSSSEIHSGKKMLVVSDNKNKRATGPGALT